MDKVKRQIILHLPYLPLALLASKIGLAYLAIEKGEDYCTLVTCVPFGVNTHRLLVRGHRVEYTESTDETIQEDETNAEPVASTWEQQYIKGLMIALIIMLFGIILSRLTIFRRRGKHEARPSQRTTQRRR